MHPATLIALLALFVALGGPAEAARLINGKNIRKGTVRGKQIKDRSLTTRDLSVGTRSSLRATPAGSVGTAQILNGSVSLEKLAPNSVTGNQVFDRSLTGVDLATDTIGAAQLAPNAVTNSEIATNAVTKSNIGTSAVGKAEIGSAAVGTDEVIDGDLRLGDLGAFAALVSADFPAIAKDSCADLDVPVTPIQASTPAQDLTKAIVLVGQPPALASDTLSIAGRATGPGTLHLRACNTGPDLADPAAVQIPFVALAP